MRWLWASAASPASSLAARPRPCPATSGASCPSRPPTPNSSSARSGAGSKACASRSNGAPAAAAGRHDRLGRRRRDRRKRQPRPGSTSCRSSPARPSWAVPPPGFPVPARARPRPTCRQPEPPRTAWKSLAHAAVARYGPDGSFWAREPEPARTADPHLADLERAELQVLRHPAQPGRIRSAGQRSPTAALQARRSRRAGRPRRALRAAARGTDRKGKHTSVNWFASDFLEQDVRDQPGDQVEVQRGRAASLHLHYRRLTPRDRRSAERPRRSTTPARACGSPSSVGAPSRRPPATRSPRVRPARRPSSKAPSTCCSASRQMEAPLVYWFSVDDLGGRLQLLRRLRPLREGFVPKKSWFAYVKFAGGTP